MQFEITIQSGATAASHTVQIPAHLCDPALGRTSIAVDGVALELDWAEIEPGVYSLIIGGRSYLVSARPKGPGSAAMLISIGTRRLEAEVRDLSRARRTASGAVHHAPLEIVAPMPGRIVRILAHEGADVSAGHGLLVVEAMKMQNEIRAPRALRVQKVHVREGEGVEAGARLLSIT